jgi:hypothetical protein
MGRNERGSESSATWPPVDKQVTYGGQSRINCLPIVDWRYLLRPKEVVLMLYGASGKDAYPGKSQIT